MSPIRIVCVCLFTLAMAPAMPPAHADPPPPSPATLKVESDFVSRLWGHLREQDRLLQEMLGRISRIETLVVEIHRLLARWPIATASPATKTAPPSLAEEEDPTAAVLPWSIAVIALLVVLALAWRQRSLERRLACAAAPAPATDRATSPLPSPAPAPSPLPAIPADTSDQALELAEIMLSMGLGHGAAQTLLEQIQREPKQALRHWLKLLEIYRRNGQQAEFEHSAEELRRYFNVHPEDWRKPAQTASSGKSLEDFPHIIERLVARWGKPECREYIESLLFDNRGGTRRGFPQSVAEELLLLSAIARVRATL